MKGGFWIATDEAVFDRAASILQREGGVAYGGGSGRGVHLEDGEGRTFLLYESTPGLEWEYREGPFVAAPGVSIPDMSHVFACSFECRWEELTARLSRLLARSSDQPTWLLDGDGVVWDAESVDPRRLRL